jgi:hypothetical protein
MLIFLKASDHYLLPKKASNKSRLAYRARPHGSLGYVVAMQELLH